MDYSLSAGEAAAVVVSAAGMYLAVLLLLALAGRRITSGLTAYDLAVGMALGALVGRTVLGYTPTLPAGLIGLATLGVLHAGTRALAGSGMGEHFPGGRPVLVLHDGRVLPEALARARLSPADLHAALRHAGVAGYAEVAAVVVERSGLISVVRRGGAGTEALAEVL